VHFAFFNGQVHFAATAITEHHVELDAERLLEKPG
jgi:hypothetical protein